MLDDVLFVEALLWTRKRILFCSMAARIFWSPGAAATHFLLGRNITTVCPLHKPLHKPPHTKAPEHLVGHGHIHPVHHHQPQARSLAGRGDLNWLNWPRLYGLDWPRLYGLEGPRLPQALLSFEILVIGSLTRSLNSTQFLFLLGNTT